MSRRNQQTVLEKIVLGIFAGIWWLVKLPFRRKKSGGKISLADQKYIMSKRHEIEKMAQSDNIYELKHAVIEADKLVDFILKKRGFAGETFADRLRSAEKKIDQANYQNLWNAHKVRNQIAHDDVEISKGQLIKAIRTLMEDYYA